MNTLTAALLGIVQGLCEFLPVSSSGHLVLLQNIFGIDEGTLFFDVMLHIGTLAAVFAVYYKKIWALIKKPFQRLTLLLAVSTLAMVAVALIFRDTFENAFGGGLLGFGFLLTTVVLFINQFKAKGTKSPESLSIHGAVGIGLMQGIAIFPGLSRSGSTITGARLLGLGKDEAAEYSFLLSIPAILGSLVLQLPDVFSQGIGGLQWSNIIIGTLAAAVSGYLAIRLMLRLIREKSLLGFGIYTAILGVLVLADQLIFNLFFANPFV